jgi:hypothetical protein
MDLRDLPNRLGESQDWNRVVLDDQNMRAVRRIGKTLTVARPRRRGVGLMFDDLTGKGTEAIQ